MATPQIKPLDASLVSGANSSAHWWPETQAERTAVRDQLDRILASNLFRNSRRYPRLLRFAVERAVEGHTDHLKERTLGVEVFGRDPSYDTNLDPVVRITAVEIRKRIAQYYREPGRETEIRIDFPPGSYLPEFRLPPALPVSSLDEPLKPAVVAPVLAPAAVPKTTLLRFRGLSIGAASVLGVAVVASLLWLRPWSPASALDEFWGQVLDAPGVVLLCMGDTSGTGAPLPTPGASPVPAAGTAPAAVMSVRDLQRADQVAFADATTMSMLTGLFQLKNKPYRIRRGSLMRLADLREGPVVLVGAYNNSWTMRLFTQTRFRFAKNQGGRIEDSQNPSRAWSVDISLPYTAFPEDYALVSRMIDLTTGRLVVVAGGITRYGTLAAGEFLTDEAHMKELERVAPKGWERKNIQVVLGTRVVGENSGPPRILATYFW